MASTKLADAWGETKKYKGTTIRRSAYVSAPLSSFQSFAEYSIADTPGIVFPAEILLAKGSHGRNFGLMVGIEKCARA
jgi:hypothetical protein